MNIKNTCKKA